jgi:multicomponent Na+:H+ antiporter subunit A
LSPLFISLLALTLTSPLLWIIRPYRFRHIGWIAALVPTIIALWLCYQLPSIAAGNAISANLLWSPHLGLEVALRVDGLAAFFGLLITVIGAAIALYTGYYFEGEPRLGYFYGLLFLFMASMLGLVWADNLLVLYAFWEGTSVTSYLLIAFNDTDKDAQEGARRAFLVTVLGSLAMLMGMVLLATNAGTYTISELLTMPGLAQSAIAPAAIALLLVGAFTKSAQFPFHFWLPGAMSAPTPASAYLHSATMVKAGVYLLARLHPALSSSPIWFWGLFLIGSVTMIVGAISALKQTDIKALLAYATVSQLGLFVTLLAFRNEAVYTAVIVYILAHALYKGPLFMVAGIIDHATGTRDLRRLANLRTSMPLLTIVALLAALSMAGVPPMLGFVAKELMLESFLHISESMAAIGWSGLIVSLIVAALTAAASLILLWEAFFRPQSDAQSDDSSHNPDPAHLHHAPSPLFVLSPLLLVLIALAIPFFLPQVQTLIFDPAATSIAAVGITAHLALWHGLNFTLLLSAIALLLGVGVVTLRQPIRQLLALWPERLSGAALWDAAVRATYALANWVTLNVQGITLLQQARGILIAAVIAMIFALSAVQWPQDFPINWSVEPTAPEVIMATLAIFSAVITVVSPTRLSAITSLGVVGIAMTLFFVFHSAPDLALTQLLVDILTIVLLILVFHRIPPNERFRIAPKTGIRNIILSIFVGFLGFFFVLFAVSRPFFPSIGDYFLYNAVPLAHGGNVVNVLLVDFRGFDTYGEITVLGIAAVGGYAILRAGLLRFRPPAPIKETSEAPPSATQEIPHV